MSITREDMKPWVIEALQANGGKAWPREVAKFIWQKHSKALQSSEEVLYTWQYDIRWAAQSLRNSGCLKPVHRRRDLPWELSDGESSIQNK